MLNNFSRLGAQSFYQKIIYPLSDFKLNNNFFSAAAINKKIHLKYNKDNIFIISLGYTVSLNVVDHYIPAHKIFLDKFYENNLFITSGRKNPRTGGIIVAYAKNTNHINEIITEDPFYQNGIADYFITEFVPNKNSVERVKDDAKQTIPINSNISRNDLLGVSFFIIHLTYDANSNLITDKGLTHKDVQYTELLDNLHKHNMFIVSSGNSTQNEAIIIAYTNNNSISRDIMKNIAFFQNDFCNCTFVEFIPTLYNKQLLFF